MYVHDVFVIFYHSRHPNQWWSAKTVGSWCLILSAFSIREFSAQLLWNIEHWNNSSGQPWRTWKLSVKARYLNVTRPFSVPGVCWFCVIIGIIRLTLWECFQSIRSSVFRAMFQHDMRESKSNEIIIPDLDFNTVKDMVRYVYSGRWKMWEYFLLLNFLGCRVSDLPDKSDLLLSAADKYDIRWSWMVNVVPFSRIQFQSKTKNNYHPKYPPKTRERSPRKSLLAIVTYKSVILFSLQRLEGRMLSVIVSQPCRWPGDLIQLSWSWIATQVWCKTDGIFLGCWYFGPLRLAQGCGVENHCHIISSCP